MHVSSDTSTPVELGEEEGREGGRERGGEKRGRKIIREERGPRDKALNDSKKLINITSYLKVLWL